MSNNNNPKISVIMPSLNVANYISQCIDSVINQSFNDIEVICIDGGSNDGTYEILEEYANKDSRISLITSDVKSYGHQMNQAMSIAKGDYIGIVETDDYIDKEMFKKLYNLTEEGNVDLVKSNFYHFNDTDKQNPSITIDKAKESLSDVTTSFTIDEYPYFLEGHPSIWSGIYKRSFLEDNDIKFIEEKGGGWVDNPFFYETAILASSIRYTPEAFYHYRESNTDSSSHNFNDFSLPMRRVLDIFDVLERHNYNNHDVIVLFYNRLFRYVEIILENNYNDENKLDYKTACYINKALAKVDESIVKEDLIPNFQKIYYKYLSPLFVKRFEDK
ncbi:MAG: glycosyltransferase [Methanosphaera sp.]|nr:glycosyltransferase [Methanosphaera sp.]